MSLLIKALNKAEEAQAQNAKTEQVEKSKKAHISKNKAELEIEADVSNRPQNKPSQNLRINTDVELSLSPAGSEFSETTIGNAQPGSILETPTSTAPVASSTQPSSSQHVAAKSATNVFSAKGLEAKTDNARLVMIAGAGLIALLGMGLYFYQFVDSSPPIVVPPRPLEQIAATPSFVASAEKAQPATNELEATSLEPAAAAIEPMPPALNSTGLGSKKTNQPALVDKDDSLFATEESATEDSTADENTANEAALNDDMQADNDSNRLQASFSANKANNKPRKSKNNAPIASANIASKSASISVTKSTPQPSVNPTLMSAYEAYNAGKDSEAQQLYKQVLKRDIGNVDALLGLGAIATRQGRIADANGWFGKVLEVDPRNSIAKTAMLDNNLMSNQSAGNELSSETSLKNMLAKHPDDANLHVALGNLYAEQNQWPAAQQAYFDAYSLNKTTDNAYNLAVSLDQMGKPKLALPYYLQALAQATDASNIDKVALQARISAIQ